jgi:predicted amidohydrolase
MVSPDGNVQRYDKMYPANFGPFEEGFYFAKGGQPTLFECDGHMIGIVVCYDLFHPEIARAYAQAGAEAMICISASPATSRPMFERILPARAVEDTLYALYVNQVGTQLNIPFFGGSQAYGPRGNALRHAGYFKEASITVDIEPLELELARRMRPTIRDCGCD